MAPPKRTRLLRLARLLSLLGTLFIVLLFSYVGIAAYFAAHVSSPTSSHTSVTFGTGNSIDIVDAFNLSNPGPFPIDGLTIVSHLQLPNTSGYLTGASRAVDLPGNTVRELAINLSLPLGNLGGAASLLVNDTTLPLYVWVNASYASLVGIALAGHSSYSWGAPFEGLVVDVGKVNVQPNGTAAITLTLSFSNHSPVWLNGTASSTLHSASGATCGRVAFPVSAPAQAVYSQSETVYLGAGCSPSGGHYTLAWTSPQLAIALPGGPLP